MPETVGTPVASADPRVGTVIEGRYRVLAPLGEGGIGSVYVAQDATSGQRLAIKILRTEMSKESEIVARFAREARAMSELTHPNVVHAYGLGTTDDGMMFMAMELAEGESLRTTLNRVRTVPLANTLEIARQIGAALTDAHARGIVHRDLKPENVIVAGAQSPEPRVKVLDFGMARLMNAAFASGGPLTKQGSVFGTPEYMPPEQACGEPVDARADQYSFGVMLFEMLSGRRPFNAATPIDVLQLQVHSAPPRLVDVAPWVPPYISSVVARMLAKRPDGRFPDVAAAVTALFARPIAERTTEPIPAPASAAAPDPRVRIGVTLAIAVVLMALALGVEAWARHTFAPAPVSAPTNPSP